MKPLVSVIVAIYNVEKFLGYCVESILGQSFKDIEIILVDDGSTDNSTAICDEYANKDSRVRVLHQQNQGVSVARNKGIEMSGADYVMFVDGDDWLEKDAVEFLYKKAVAADGIDVVIGNYFEYKSGKEENVGEHFQDGWEETYDSQSCRKEILFSVLGGNSVSELRASRFLLPAPWAKLYSREMIERNAISFPVGVRLGEDRVFNLHVVQHARKIVAVNTPIYHYRKWDGSTCSKARLGEFDLSEYDKSRDVTLSFFEKYYPREESRPFQELVTVHTLRSIQMVCYLRHSRGIMDRKEMIATIDKYADKYGIKAIPIFSGEHMNWKDKVKTALFRVRAYWVLHLYDLLTKDSSIL